MFKKVFLSPLFAPTLFFVLWGSVISAVCVYADDVLGVTADGAFIDVIAKFGYIFLIVLLFACYKDFEDKMLSWGVYIFLAVGCFLRESGVQHYLSATDSTPFKSRFFLNPDNPLYEKFLFGTILLLILSAIIYLAVKYAKFLVKSFLRFDTISWTIAMLCTAGVASKFVDRFPANYRKFHQGMNLNENVYAFLQLTEETTEMFLPYLAMLAVYQYHLLKKSN